jgi:hypothetical protein
MSSSRPDLPAEISESWSIVYPFGEIWIANATSIAGIGRFVQDGLWTVGGLVVAGGGLVGVG